MIIQISYAGSFNTPVAYWQIYDSNGNPYARVEVGEIYIFTEYGNYTVRAVIQ
jgi:hypothetical protein